MHTEIPMLDQLLELRRRLLALVVIFSSLFLLFFMKSEVLIQFLITPLLQVLPNHQGIIATELTAPLFIPITLSANAAALATTPFLLYHAWQFIAPGLYGYERQGLGSAIILSLFLFLGGLLFCFYLVLPYLFQLVTSTRISGVNLMPDMAYTLNFITRMLLIFGFSFQIPLLCLTLVQLNILDLAGLKKIRPYSIVLAFILGMLLTPPDVLSQIMLAIPLCLLFEGGIFLVRLRS